MIPPDDRSIRQSPLEGRYANYFEIGHNEFEFILDFAQVFGESEATAPHTRIVASPPYAKELLAVLRRAIGEYERAYGPIPNQGFPSK